MITQEIYTDLWKYIHLLYKGELYLETENTKVTLIFYLNYCFVKILLKKGTGAEFIFFSSMSWIWLV